MEDLDGPRVVPGAAAAILADLEWLGLDWDEGPDVSGPYAPYTQSERLGRYAAAVEALDAAGHLFRCSCSRKDLAGSRSAPHGEEPLYPGTCRGGPTHPERPAALRFRLEVPPAFVDVLGGPSAPGLGAGDFVVRRGDGLFTYQLACAVDDHQMAITEVVRGDDLAGSTPKQIALLEALGAEPPAYLHVPLVLGPDGERLGKRHGSLALADLRARGVRAERIVALLGRTLGLCDATVTELEASALVPSFAVARLPRTPVRLAEADLR
jgi:glutamyl-tRNA synthetase